MADRLTSRDWLAAGLQALGDPGTRGLTIDALSQRLGVTKGSFYHHFAGLDDFRERLLDYWEEELTHNVVAATERGGPPVAVFRRFLESLADRSPTAERTLRAWGLSDLRVRRRLERIDRTRVQQAQLWLAALGLGDDARPAARTLNALLVGCSSVVPPVESDELTAVVERFLERYAGVDPAHGAAGDTGAQSVGSDDREQAGGPAR